jgi:alkylation response protein AidB-like acyl-CoA dehydrogenase
MPLHSEDELQIVNSTVRLLEENGGLAHARRAQHGQAFVDAHAWKRMADAGWLAAMGGLDDSEAGLRTSDVLRILEECGAKVTPEPLVLALGSVAIVSRCNDIFSTKLLEQATTGQVICAPIIPQFVGKASDSLKVSQGEVFGTTSPVFDAHAATVFLLGLEIDDSYQICAVDGDAKGLSVLTKETVDGGTLAHLSFDRVPLSDIRRLNSGNHGTALMEHAANLMRLGYCAEMVGLMREVFRITLEYLKLRKQFGVPIGSFQAIQHRAATLHIEITSARSLVYEACDGLASERETLAAAAAKARVSEVMMHVVKEAVQMHGGIGYTDEHDVSLYFRRAMSLAAAGGDTVTCLKQVHSHLEEADAI